MEELKLLIIALFNDNKNRENGLTILDIFEITKSHGELVKYSKINIREVLRLFQQDDYISAHAPTGVPNAEAKYKITEKGELYLENLTKNTQEEKRRNKLQDDLNDSVIKTNASFKKLNEEVIPKLNRRQLNLTIITIVIAGLSFVAIAVSAFYQSKSVTGEQLLQLKSTLQENNRLLDSMRKSQKGIDSSLRIKATSAAGKKKS